MENDGVNFEIKSTQTGYVFSVTATEKHGRAELEGLPIELSAFLFNFTDKEILEDTVDVINVLITMYDSKGNGQVNIVN